MAERAQPKTRPSPQGLPVAEVLPDDIGVRPGGHVAVDLDAPIPVPEDLAMVGSDLDGTLLAPDLAVGPRSLSAIPRLAGAGVEFVYVTGRPPRWLRPIIAQTGHTGMAVCANGALVVDLAEERLVRWTAIEHELAAAVALRLRELVPGITFALERLIAGADAARSLDHLTVVGFEPSYDPPWARMPGVESGDILDLIGRGEPVKILAAPPVGTGHDSDSLLALAEAEYADALHITHSGTKDVLIEIMSGEIDKGVGFLEVAELRGIDPRRTAAVGDMPNDVALIRAAGTGYAVANAHPSARAAADHIIPSNSEDGVGRLLEAILEVHR
ncbi:MAG: HAD family hydrolase [Candidatus Nanopelagicales bacterium]|jgi:HAD superfamily hydrolase (TIGR01484 family)|nr:HAD family hydrolase [Candidatus Nanopelagicales bacterium]